MQKVSVDGVKLRQNESKLLIHFNWTGWGGSFREKENQVCTFSLTRNIIELEGNGHKGMAQSIAITRLQEERKQWRKDHPFVRTHHFSNFRDSMQNHPPTRMAPST